VGPGAGLDAIRRRQHGVFTRAQARAAGVSDGTLASWCRSGRVRRLHHGVYGDPAEAVPWKARVWAAWLALGPDAALTGETALRWYGLDGDWDETRIELDVPRRRRLVVPDGVKVHRCRDFADRVFGSREPAIVRIEVALLAAASGQPRDDRAVSILLDACRQHRTTAERLAAELTGRRRLPKRALLLGVLDDAAHGVHSFLELSYARRVERAHHLPTGTRQTRARAGGRTVYRDVEYNPYGLLVELDGRAGHADADSAWRDMTRDNAAALDGKLNLRFGYQLVTDPCGAAYQVALALRLRGWTGTPTLCRPGCTVAAERPARSG
jgi:Transcriptional regulator, AbiEi antitoxin